MFNDNHLLQREVCRMFYLLLLLTFCISIESRNIISDRPTQSVLHKQLLQLQDSDVTRIPNLLCRSRSFYNLNTEQRLRLHALFYSFYYHNSYCVKDSGKKDFEWDYYSYEKHGNSDDDSGYFSVYSDYHDDCLWYYRLFDDAECRFTKIPYNTLRDVIELPYVPLFSKLGPRKKAKFCLRYRSSC